MENHACKKRGCYITIPFHCRFTKRVDLLYNAPRRNIQQVLPGFIKEVGEKGKVQKAA